MHTHRRVLFPWSQYRYNSCFQKYKFQNFLSLKMKTKHPTKYHLMKSLNFSFHCFGRRKKKPTPPPTTKKLKTTRWGPFFNFHAVMSHQVSCFGSCSYLADSSTGPPLNTPVRWSCSGGKDLISNERRWSQWQAPLLDMTWLVTPLCADITADGAIGNHEVSS